MLDIITFILRQTIKLCLSNQGRLAFVTGSKILTFFTGYPASIQNMGL